MQELQQPCVDCNFHNVMYLYGVNKIHSEMYIKFKINIAKKFHADLLNTLSCPVPQ